MKTAGVDILTDKRDFKTKNIIRDKEGHVIIKGSIHEKAITTINIHAPNY